MKPTTALPFFFTSVLSQGSGPYPASYFEDASLPNHTIYQPKNPSGLKLPVIAWGNGGCSTQGTSFANFLTNVASYGAIAIANGGIKGGSSLGNPSGGMDIHPERQQAAIDWAVKVAGTANWTHIDAARVAVWGQSCGGLESYGNHNDSRVSSIGIFNSGQLSAAESTTVAGKVKKPIFFFLGGSSDIAYANGERDYDALPNGTASWLGNHAKGHGATFNEKDGGLVGVAGVKFMQWLLRGDATAAAWFQNGDAIKAGFTDQKFKNLESIKVTPI